MERKTKRYQTLIIEINELRQGLKEKMRIINHHKAVIKQRQELVDELEKEYSNDHYELILKDREYKELIENVPYSNPRSLYGNYEPKSEEE